MMAGWSHPPVSPSVLCGVGGGGVGETGGHAGRREHKQGWISSLHPLQCHDKKLLVTLSLIPSFRLYPDFP